MTTTKKRILIVEDQRLIAADLEQTLRKLNYDVIGNVATGDEALNRALTLNPDMILMDVRLGDHISGIEAAKAIHERMDVPIIYITAYADEETIQAAMLTGPFGYLVKPFNERELRAAIEIAIFKHSTEHMLIEERARRQAAEEFKLLVECVQDYGIFLLDAAGRIASWNVGAERIIGYQAAEILGQHASIFYTAEDREAQKLAVMLETAEKSGRAEDEGWRVRKDGSQFWANVVITALRDEPGHLHGFGKVVRDMSARRAAEMALRESSARTSAMIASALDAIICIDMEGSIVEWNPAAERTLGYRRSEALGRDMADLIIPERLRARHREGLARYQKTGKGAFLGSRVEMTAVTSEGAEIVIELSIAPVPTGATTLVTGFLRDVTARKEAESMLRQTTAYQRFLDHTTVSLTSSLDVDSTLRNAALFAVSELADWCVIDMVNDRGNLMQMAGKHADPERDDLTRNLRTLVPLDLDLTRGAHNVLRTSKAEFYPVMNDVKEAALLLGVTNLEALHRIGIGACACIPLRYRGKTQGVIHLVNVQPTHYTPYFHATAEEFARRIGLAIENAQLYQEAQEAIRLRDEFVQVASHELRTPLTLLQLQLDTVGRNLDKLNPEIARFATRVDAATKQTVRLGRLVDCLLDMTRITAGKLELQNDTVDISELVKELVERFRSDASRTGSEIAVHADQPVVGAFDRMRLEQILSNLISNAIKYGQGKPISIDVQNDERMIRVSVTDHGMGMDQETLGRIFKRFERGVPPRNISGLGLGLFIASQLAAAHEGTIVAFSQPGIGSTFTLQLPHNRS